MSAPIEKGKVRVGFAWAAFCFAVALFGALAPPASAQGSKSDKQPPPDPTPGIYQQGPPSRGVGVRRPDYSRVPPPTPMIEIKPSLDQLKENVSDLLTNNGHLQEELSSTAPPNYRSVAAYARELRRVAFRLQRFFR